MFVHHFEWDPEKARTNLTKHGVSFGLAASVFLDPLAVTIFDPDHTGQDERWVTRGYASTGVCLVVVHNWEEIEPGSAIVRIISARDATRREIRDHKERFT
jgi:uncharacterized DUF497 family protein